MLRGRRLLAAVAMLAFAAPAAQAVSCKPGKYAGVDHNAFPMVLKLEAVKLPKKTDGYAPRCLVAESVGAALQRSWREFEGPKSVRVYGARWDGGRWRCRYRQRGDNELAWDGAVATCRQGKRRITVVMSP